MSLVELAEKLNTLQETISSWEHVIQIGYYPTPDALIAATIFGRTFIELEIPFVIFKCDSPIDEAMDRGNYNYIFIGHPLQLYTDELLSKDFIAITYPQEGNSGERVLNPKDFGYSIPEVTISSVSYLICDPMISHISEVRDYIILLPLIAQQTISMKSDPVGIQQNILQEALEYDLITEQKTIGILGSDVFSLKDALFYSQDPFLPNLTDNDNQIVQLLGKSNIISETSDGERRFSDLEFEEIKSLNIALVKYLSTNSGFKNSDLNLIKTKLCLNNEKTDTILHSHWDYARSVLDAINRNQHSTIVSVLLGNRGSKLRELSRIYKEERKSLTTSYDFLLNKKEQVVENAQLRYLKTDKKISWYNAIPIAAMALAGELVDIDRPFALVIPGPGDLYTIGIRASSHLDLSEDLDSMMSSILKSYGIISPVIGDRYAAQCSIEENMWETIIVDLTSRLEGEITHEV